MQKVIAIDFDGCLCENAWPDIGAPIQATIDRMKREQALGSRFILWTCRNGYKLLNALEWCKQHGITFDAVNENLPDIIELYSGDCRKIFADEYWDDKAVCVP